MNLFTTYFLSHRFLTLLLVLLATTFIQPFARGFIGGLIVFDVFLTLLFLAVVMSVFSRSRDKALSLSLAVPTILIRWIAYGMTGHDQSILNAVQHALGAAFLGFAVLAILRGIFEEKTIRTDHMIGTICGYLLAGVAWGNCYSAADLLATGAFRVTPEVASQFHDENFRSFFFNYFSLCALTGAGFGDITPVLPFVATLTWLEAAFGQFYLALVVAQLVGLKFAHAVDGAPQPSGEHEPPSGLSAGLNPPECSA